MQKFFFFKKQPEDYDQSAPNTKKVGAKKTHRSSDEFGNAVRYLGAKPKFCLILVNVFILFRCL